MIASDREVLSPTKSYASSDVYAAAAYGGDPGSGAGPVSEARDQEAAAEALKRKVESLRLEKRALEAHTAYLALETSRREGRARFLERKERSTSSSPSSRRKELSEARSAMIRTLAARISAAKEKQREEEQQNQERAARQRRQKQLD